MTTKSLVEGRTYTRHQISKAIGGGELRDYLPSSGGQILAGCFKPGLNRRAPFEVDVGNGPKVIKKAEAIANSGHAIPVFLKRKTNEWVYAGKFKCLNFSRKRRDIRAHSDRRHDTVGVLYFDSVSDGKTPVEDPELLESHAIEGKLVFLQHLAKERKRGLILAKRNEVRNAHGCLVCEACGTEEKGLPKEYGEACFEVHHRKPLSALKKETETRLSDLAILCANCHRMIHRTVPMVAISTLAEKLRGLRARS